MTTLATPHPLTEALGHAPADKRLEVLRRVGQTGSISQAARDAGISYKAAWQAIETLTNLSGLLLVDRSVGGSGGGGARITADGTRLLALADELSVARAQVLARHGQGDSGGAMPSSLGLRTSMRNQLPCLVDALRPVAQGPMVSVALHTACGQSLTSLVTRESAEMLGLAPGQKVLVLCKATAVAVAARQTHTHTPTLLPGHAMQSTQTSAPASACELHGVVHDVSPAPGAREVVLALPGGGIWVGFSVEEAALRVGEAAFGLFSSAALVIGLAG
jgi:molybdate transport system regulatory protein